MCYHVERNLLMQTSRDYFALIQYFLQYSDASICNNSTSILVAFGLSESCDVIHRPVEYSFFQFG